ncbi:MAG TPA: hypothetical protein PLB35_08905 [Myxococcota bacterium]|nr:hypothetical protein [Myxococcota bacterium]HOH77362.1 hypothetical protein [Myxococcota bacterium]
MARKKSRNTPEEKSRDLNPATPDVPAVDVAPGDASGPEVPDVPAVPSVPDAPPSMMAPPPPPSPTSSMKAFDLPPLHVGEGHAQGKGNVLKGILERTQQEAEKEAARLMDSLKVQQDAQRMAREEEDRRKAAEARAKVEEERRRREAALKEYEDRQRRKEEAERARTAPAPHETVSMQASKGGRGWIVGLAVAVVVLGGGGFAGWKIMNMVSPTAFNVDSPIERARGGAVVTTPIVYGPSTLKLARSVDAELLVAGIAPAKYEAEAPAPVVRKTGKAPQEKKIINIRTGILGGKKVIR